MMENSLNFHTVVPIIHIAFFSGLEGKRIIALQVSFDLAYIDPDSVSSLFKKPFPAGKLNKVEKIHFFQSI